VQAWKEAQQGGDPEAANAEFIRLHSNGGQLFDR